MPRHAKSLHGQAGGPQLGPVALAELQWGPNWRPQMSGESCGGRTHLGVELCNGHAGPQLSHLPGSCPLFPMLGANGRPPSSVQMGGAVAPVSGLGTAERVRSGC